MAPTTDYTRPQVDHDLPLGSDGLAGRMLILSPYRDPGRGHQLVYTAVYYRGTNDVARRKIAACPLEDLRGRLATMSTVERRAAKNATLEGAIASALDLPPMHAKVRSLLAYLAAVVARNER